MIDWTKRNITVPSGTHYLPERVNLDHEAHVVLEAGSELLARGDVGLFFNASNSTLSGPGRIVGGPSCRYVVWFYQADHVRVRDVEIRCENKLAKYLLCMAAGSDISVKDCTIVGPRPEGWEKSPSRNDVDSRSPAGITIRTDGEERSVIDISGCRVSGCGIGILTGSTRHMVIERNMILDNTGQHGMYLSHTIDCVVRDNVLAGINLQGIKVQATDKDDSDSGSVIIADNDIAGVNSHGILLTTIGDQKNAVRNVIVTGNRISSRIDGDRQGEIGAVTNYGDNCLIQENTTVGFEHDIWERQ